MFSQLASEIPHVEVDGKNYYELAAIEATLSKILNLEYNLSEAASSVTPVVAHNDSTGTTKNYYTEENLYMLLLSDHGLFSMPFRHWLSSCVLPLMNNKGAYMTLSFGNDLIRLISDANKNMEAASKNLDQLSQEEPQESDGQAMTLQEINQGFTDMIQTINQ